MIFFSTPSRGQQVLTPLGSAQTTSLLVVLICGTLIVIHYKLYSLSNDCREGLLHRTHEQYLLRFGLTVLCGNKEVLP